MGGADKEFEAFQIFEQIKEQGEDRRPSQSERAASHPLQAETAPYYEIEYDSCPLPGVGKYVLKSDQIQPRARDAVRERFDEMREIARESRFITFSNSKFFDERTRRENARIFYRQGMFMKDFEDTYEKVVPYSAYFPSYQMMGYEQLRTYFTWRTLVRQGFVPHISLSYAFLYLYELLNNIGTEGPQDALDRLMFFWEVYRVYDASVDKYVLKWLKDYHIYYELPQSFKEFTEEFGLTEHYPGLTDPKDDFALFCSISKYDIRKSAFYSEVDISEKNSSKGSSLKGDFTEKDSREGSDSEKGEGTNRKTLIRDCFSFTMDRLRQIFAESHIKLDEYIFQPTKSRTVWVPFREALFYPAVKQRDRQVILSEKESYQCCQNNWTHSTMITSESGKRLIGYVMKQMEAVLRKLTEYRHKLSANLNMLSDIMREELAKAGISLEKAVTDAVTDFYREATKTVVRVDANALEKIRREALVTQEKLIVLEEDTAADFTSVWQKAAEEQFTSAYFQEIRTGGTDVPRGKPEEDNGENAPENPLQRGTFQMEALECKKPKEESDSRKGQQEELKVESGSRKGQQEELKVESGSLEEQWEAGKEEFESWTGMQVSMEESSPWDALRAELTETELSALRLLSEGGADIKHFADEHGIMLEVLADGINEKAADVIGDSLLDGEFMIYEDYADQVKGMVEAV